MKKNIFLKKVFAAGVICSLVFFCALPGASVTAWAFPTAGTAVSGNVNVRDAIRGNLVASLSAGQKVTVQKEKKDTDGTEWYYVTLAFEGKTVSGWVRSDLIKETGTDSSASEGQESKAVFKVDGKDYYVADPAGAASVPKDFTETSFTYNGIQTTALKAKFYDLFLVYLVNQGDSEDNGFYVYDQESDTVSPYLELASGNQTVIPVQIPKKLLSEVPESYKQLELTVQDEKIQAYQYSDNSGQASSDKNNGNGFYYFYGISNQGYAGWYVYDTDSGSCQKSQADLTSGGQGTASQNQEMLRMLGGGLGVICLLLFVLFIAASGKYKALRRILDQDGTEGDIQAGPYPEAKADPPEREVRAAEEPEFGQTKKENGKIQIDIPHKRVEMIDLDDEYDGYNAESGEEPEFYDDEELADTAAQEGESALAEKEIEELDVEEEAPLEDGLDNGNEADMPEKAGLKGVTDPEIMN